MTPAALAAEVLARHHERHDFECDSQQGPSLVPCLDYFPSCSCDGPWCADCEKSLPCDAVRLARVVERLLAVVEAAALVVEPVCSFVCPSVWPTGTPQPHVRACERLSGALAALEAPDVSV